MTALPYTGAPPPGFRDSPSRVILARMADREPTRRAILLGASNLRAALPAVLHGLRRQGGGPLEAFAACGHGRSYGSTSRFLFVRRLPGIAGCGLWDALRTRPGLPGLALITDVGNDLAYGFAPDRIASWVETCLDRLATPSTAMVMTPLPLSHLERLEPWQARLALSLLFPGRSAPWPALLDRARGLDERLRGLARDFGARLVEPGPDWYGLDPIHLRRSRRREAWSRILGLGPDSAVPPARLSLPLLGAKEVEILGFSLRRAQPALLLPDGTSLSLY
ncbi:MAG: hypothetical protein ACJ75H_06850 [Thermoanaerobaculia bacterium]